MIINNDRIICFDTEFTGLHRNTTLISLGAVLSNGNTFYAEFTDYDKSQINPWLQEHVIENLILHDELEVTQDFDCIVKGDREIIKKAFFIWLELNGFHNTSTSEDPVTFYSDCLTYDWMLLTDLLFGDALNIPEGFNYIPIDLSTMLLAIGEDPDVSREDFAEETPALVLKHNALADASIIRICAIKCRELLDSVEEVGVLSLSGEVTLGDPDRFLHEVKPGAVWIGEVDVINAVDNNFHTGDVVTVVINDEKITGELFIDMGLQFSLVFSPHIDTFTVGDIDIIKTLTKYKGLDVSLLMSKNNIKRLR